MKRREASLMLGGLLLLGPGARQARAALPPHLGPSTVSGMVTALEAAGFTGPAMLEAWEALVVGLARWTGFVKWGAPTRMLVSAEQMAVALQRSQILRQAVYAILKEQIAAGITGPQLLARLSGHEIWMRLLVHLVPGTVVTRASLLRVFAVLMMIVVTAAVAGTAGFVASSIYVSKLDMEAKAAEDSAYQETMDRIERGLGTGSVKLLGGITIDQALGKIRDNLDAGLPPYAGVLEARQPPDIAGGWEGDLVVKDIQGQSNIQLGQRRRVTPGQFRIEQDATELTLTFGGNRIKGRFESTDLLESRVGTRTLTVVDKAILREPVGGTVRRVALKFYSGAGAGGLANKLEVELEQQSAGGTITSGGQLVRGGR